MVFRRKTCGLFTAYLRIDTKKPDLPACGGCSPDLLRATGATGATGNLLFGLARGKRVVTRMQHKKNHIQLSYQS